MDVATAQAVRGCDAGLIVYSAGNDVLKAAIVFAPEVPLKKAVAMLPICGIGFQNALGALAPPEVAVHLQWDGGLRINGARCGKMHIRAPDVPPEDTPDWMIIGLTLPLWPTESDGGYTPDETALYAEGCTDVNAISLLESWAKHTLVWINRWSEEGTAPLHAEWRGLAHGTGEQIEIDGTSGVYLGVDEDFGLLLRTSETTKLIPLTHILET
jgi:biotin-(acetyl-CoA carboxylase) ligase